MLTLTLLLAVAGLPAAERDAIMEAAGATRRGKAWALCPDEARPEGIAVESFSDLNGDGRPEALLTEVGHRCFGAVGIGYALVSQGSDGRWRKLSGGAGAAELMPTRGPGGWPDLSITGPAFCFPVHRWDGRAYALHRHEYAGKPCRPGG